MHSETLLYMIMQMDTTTLAHEKAGAKPPQGLMISSADYSPRPVLENKMITIPPGIARLGVDFGIQR